MLQQAPSAVVVEGEDAPGRQRQAGGQAGWRGDNRARCFKVTSLRAVLGAGRAANAEHGDKRCSG